LKRYKHLLSFDLSGYGAALTLINQFVDDENIKVLEISPCGGGAQLILLSDEATALNFIYAESYSLFKNQILAAQVIENIHPDLLPTYLSQNKARLSTGLLLLEGTSVTAAFSIADQLLKKSITLVDFRVVRTFPKNVMITATAAQKPDVNTDFKSTWIESVNSALKSYYEIT